ncbi:MAG: hypothetical protein WDZ70_02270 [Candidatus Paceibacterota bacterium]
MVFKKFKRKAQGFALKKMMDKKGVPQSQKDMILGMMEKNPELFEKIQKEIKAKQKDGKGEMAATMEVMRKYQAELQKLAQE